MKKLSTPLLMLLLCLTTAVSNAQTTKPNLFAAYPQRIDVSETIFQNAFTSSKGQAVAIALGSTLVFKGTVVANEFKYANLQSITIKSPEFDDAFLSISKIINDDKTVTYTGRILNSKAADGYEIKRDAAGNYKLLKFESNRILQDCSYN